MTINYLLRREQEELHRAESAKSRSARLVHKALALAYGKLLSKSTYPHNRFESDAERGVKHRSRLEAEAEDASWENEGGAKR
ncbi:hypothetical protein [Sphingomonas guangdongensis]|uniref:hypothetical protein n=1 Tax=Sphingomonas guangdongensis TaxID=1141890 RepID=UPI001181B381|nr:hypothetical protein [Sphingomonas guangdongensis]